MCYRSDVLLCADVIFEDLSQHSNVDALYLLEMHGGRPAVDRKLPKRQVAFYDGETVVVALGCSQEQYNEALPHELVHRLADTPRYAWLNRHIQGWRYSRTGFLEDVATLVGERFALRWHTKNTKTVNATSR